MGSSCSILNDTEHNVWITHEVNWEHLIGVTRDVVHAVELGAKVLSLFAPDEDEGAQGGTTSCKKVAKQRKGEITEKGKKAGWTKRDWMQVICGLEIGDEVLAGLLEISQREVEKMKRTIREFKEKSELIKPGEKYTCPGTVSLSLRVFVMNDKLQFDDAGCQTSSIADGENFYTISNHFRKLDVY